MKKILYILATVIILAVPFNLLGLEPEDSLAISAALLVAGFIILLITVKGEPEPLNPEFSKPAIPYEGKLEDIDIEAEYKARWDTYKKMNEDSSVSEKELSKYLAIRIYPFHPVGQYWTGLEWKDCKPGVSYPEWKLYPRMINPMNQQYYEYDRGWMNPQKRERQIRKQERKEAWKYIWNTPSSR